MNRNDPFVSQVVKSLRIGMTRDEVHAVLGPPDDCDTGTNRRRRPLIWKYRDVELHFEEPVDGRLFLVYLEDNEHQPHTLLSKENNRDTDR